MTTPKILIADDSLLDKQLMLQLLKGFDAEVVLATNGKEAYELALEILPNVILMDWVMPEISGEDAIKLIKSHVDLKNIPILVITGIEVEKNLQKILDAGAMDFVQKPVRKIDLFARLQSALKLSQYQKQQEDYIAQFSYQNQILQKTNEQLRSREKIFKNIYQYTPAMMHTIDIEGKIVNASNYWLEKMCYTFEEVKGKPLLDFLSQESTELSSLENIPEFFRTGEAFNQPYQFISQKGDVIDILLSATPQKDGSGKINHILVVSVDVTEKKKEEAIAKSFEKGLQALTYISSNVHVNFDKIINDALKYMVKHFNADLGLISKISEDILEVIYYHANKKEVRDNIKNKIEIDYYSRKCYDSDDVLSIPYLTEKANAFHPFFGKSPIDMFIGTPIKVKGKKIGNICFISKKPRIEGFTSYDKKFMQLFGRWVSFSIERKQITEELISINDSQERILATVAHDLRNPIHSIQGISSILKIQNRGKDNQDSSFYQIIDESCTKALNLIKELLEISELENKDYQLETYKTEVNQFIKQTISPFEESITQKQLNLKYQLTDDDAFVNINKQKFSRVIENLITNAQKFTEEGGDITVSVAQENGDVKILIKDTGIGIPKDLQPIIFNKFSSARRTGLKGEKSTGLGMSIVKQIVDLHLGEISVESEEDVGTTFHILLPKVE